jgi:hypothetical protein
MTMSGVDAALGLEPDFELTCEIRVVLSDLHAFLCDLHQYVPLHPFIESIQDLPPTPELPRARRYRVVDRIPLGPFKLKTVYTAALDPVSPEEVHGYAWQAPGVRLRTVYALSRTAEGTRIVERCSVEAHSLLRRFVVSQARKAHKKTLEEMKGLLEDRSPRTA